VKIAGRLRKCASAKCWGGGGGKGGVEDCHVEKAVGVGTPSSIRRSCLLCTRSSDRANQQAYSFMELQLDQP
jgi:hypothetical protein